MTVHITDHALLRWLQRAHDIDMDHFRAELAKLAAPYAALKVQHVEVGGVWFVFDGKTLITVTPDKPPASQMHRHDRGTHNGTHLREPLHWRGQKRKRSHK